MTLNTDAALNVTARPNANHQYQDIKINTPAQDSTVAQKQ